MNEFENSDLVMRLYVNHEISYEVGVKGCTSIIAVVKSGKMEDVLWFEVFVDYKLHSKWNSALILGVVI